MCVCVCVCVCVCDIIYIYIYIMCVGMRRLDPDLAFGEKALRQLPENAASCIEQVQETASHKAAVVRTLTTHLENYPN